MDAASPHPPTLQKWSQSIMKMKAAILLYRHHLESESGLSWLGGGVGTLWSSATFISHQAGALCQMIWQRLNELAHIAPTLSIRQHKEMRRSLTGVKVETCLHSLRASCKYRLWEGNAGSHWTCDRLMTDTPPPPHLKSCFNLVRFGFSLLLPSCGDSSVQRLCLLLRALILDLYLSVSFQ